MIKQILSGMAALTLCIIGTSQSQADAGDRFTQGALSYYVLTEDAATQTGTVEVRGSSSGISGEITIPKSVTSLGVTYTITSIPDMAFELCWSIKSISIPDSVTSIGNYAFYGCVGLTTLTIPDGVTSIGEWVFVNCTGLTSLTIPDSITSIGEFAFSGCSSLPNITIPDNITNIADGVFSLCSNLESLTIPDGVTSIGELAFFGCSRFTSLTIPENVASIGDRVFGECTSLKSVYFKGKAPSVGRIIFEECVSMQTVYYVKGKRGWEDNPWPNSREGYPLETWVPEEEDSLISLLPSIVEKGKVVGIELTFKGTLEWSENLKDWQPVTGSSDGKYQVDTRESQRCFYRVVQD